MLSIFWGVLATQIVFAASESSSDKAEMKCRQKFIKQFKRSCGPIDTPPCYYNTTFNRDTQTIEQVKLKSLQLTADFCCREPSLCTNQFIETEVCCTGRTCMLQCYGVAPPYTRNIYKTIRGWKVEETRNQRPPKKLIEKVLNQ